MVTGMWGSWAHWNHNQETKCMSKLSHDIKTQCPTQWPTSTKAVLNRVFTVSYIESPSGDQLSKHRTLWEIVDIQTKTLAMVLHGPSCQQSLFGALCWIASSLPFPDSRLPHTTYVFNVHMLMTFTPAFLPHILYEHYSYIPRYMLQSSSQKS